MLPAPEGDKEAKAEQLEMRNERFKMIPRIVEGPYVVRAAVGNKPALLARKIDFKWFDGPNYLEADVDIASSRASMSSSLLFSRELRYFERSNVLLGHVLRSRWCCWLLASDLIQFDDFDAHF